MASNDAERRRPPSMAEEINARHLAVTAPAFVAQGRLSVMDGVTYWNEPVPEPDPLERTPIALDHDTVIDWDDPSLVLPAWAEGLTAEERNWVLSVGGDIRTRDRYADDLRQRHGRQPRPSAQPVEPEIRPTHRPDALGRVHRVESIPMEQFATVLTDEEFAALKPATFVQRHKDRSKGYYERAHGPVIDKASGAQDQGR